MQRLSTKRILIVDDEKDIRESLAEALELNNYATVGASNGHEALAILDGPVRPSLILLDLMMPFMDGFEFMKHKEQKKELKDIPVVVISAASGLEERLKIHRVAGCLVKPITLEKLLSITSSYL